MHSLYTADIINNSDINGGYKYTIYMFGGVCFQQKGQYLRFVLVEFHQPKKDACKTTGTLHIFLDDWGLTWFKQDTANKNNGKMEPAKMVVLNKDNHDGNVL